MFAEQLAGDRIVEQQHSTTGFSSHPFSYGMEAFPAMAGNRAVSSHVSSHGWKQGCFQPC